MSSHEDRHQDRERFGTADDARHDDLDTQGLGSGTGSVKLGLGVDSDALGSRTGAMDTQRSGIGAMDVGSGSTARTGGDASGSVGIHGLDSSKQASTGTGGPTSLSGAENIGTRTGALDSTGREIGGIGTAGTGTGTGGVGTSATGATRSGAVDAGLAGTEEESG